MNYELIVYITIAFVLGRWSKLRWYYGPNKEEYKKADIGILTK